VWKNCTKLIGHMLTYELDAKGSLTFASEGERCDITLPLQ
jgi:hypothetical protein